MGDIFPVAALKILIIRKYYLRFLPCYKKNLHPLNSKTINARVSVHLGFSSTKQYSRIARRKNYKGAGNRTFWLVRFDYRYLKLANVIRNSLKALFSKAFRRFTLERRQPFIVLSHQKSKLKSSLSGRRFFEQRIFVKLRHKSQ